MKNEENTRMKKFKGCIICFTLALMTIILCSCNKQHDKITLSEPILNKISELEDKYGVTINYCNVPVEEDVNLEYEIASDEKEIEVAVDVAEVIFSRLNDEWAKYLMNPDVDLGMIRKITKVNVVFCEELEGDTDAFGNEFSFGGLFTCSEDTLYLMADIHNFEAEKSIAEMVVIRILNKVMYDDDTKNMLFEKDPDRETGLIETIFTYYDKCNPDNFEYYGYIADVKEEHKEYVYSEDSDIENIYFVNEESVYSEYLDCIYMTTPLLYTNEDEKLPLAFNSPHIQEKILYTIGRFDMVFLEQGYWNRWFE